MINQKGENALTIHIKHHGKGVNSDVIMLLIAAGESVQQSPPGLKRVLSGIPAFTDRVEPSVEEVALSLKYLSGQAVRKHILAANPHEHLFDKVKHLEIPYLLIEYLVYSVDFK